MSLVCSVIFIHHAFNANILDKDYAFSDGEILMLRKNYMGQPFPAPRCF